MNYDEDVFSEILRIPNKMIIYFPRVYDGYYEIICTFK